MPERRRQARVGRASSGADVVAAASGGRLGRLAAALRPVVEELGDPAPDAARAAARSGASATRPCSAGRSAAGQRPRRSRGPAGRSAAIGSPIRDPDPAAEPEPGRPVDRDRDERHVRAQGEVRRPLVERPEVRLDRPDPPLPGDRDDAAGLDDRARPGGSPRAGRSCPACTGSSCRSSSSAGCGRRRAMSSSFGPKNVQPRADRQDGHQHERVGPGQVVEAVDRRAAGSRSRPSRRSRRYARRRSQAAMRATPVPDRPAPGWTGRSGRHRGVGAASGRRRRHARRDAGRRPGADRRRDRGRRAGRGRRRRAPRRPGAGGTTAFGTRTTRHPGGPPGRRRR